MSHERGLETLPVWNNFAVLEKAAFQRHQLWRPLEEKTGPVGAVFQLRTKIYMLIARLLPYSPVFLNRVVFEWNPRYAL